MRLVNPVWLSYNVFYFQILLFGLVFRIFTMQSGSIITEIRPKKPGELNPLIVEFLNGEVPEEKLSMLQVKLKPYENLKEKVIEISTPDNQKYVNDPINKLFVDNQYVAIRNKKTNKMRLVEVGLTPVINSLYFKKVEIKVDNRDVKEQIATLQRVFGTKRAIRLLEQREALEIDRSHVEVQINEMLQDTSGNSFALNESLNKTSDFEEECLSNLIPPCHREAINIVNVYRVEDCISVEEITSLKDGIEKILNLDKNLQNESAFMQAYLSQALDNMDNLEVRLACLLYAEALVKYIRAPAKSLAKIAQNLCPHSKLVGDKIIREFCVKTGNSLNRPLAMKDKAVCYIIVLVLIACNYKIDLEVLSKISCCSYKKLKQLGRIIGVLPASKTSGIHVLALPLPPPVKMVKSSKSVSRR